MSYHHNVYHIKSTSLQIKPSFKLQQHYGNGINDPASEVVVKRKWNGGNGHENAVTVKNMPNFLSTWADTKKLDLMNLLTEEVAKASKEC